MKQKFPNQKRKSLPSPGAPSAGLSFLYPCGRVDEDMVSKGLRACNRIPTGRQPGAKAPKGLTMSSQIPFKRPDIETLKAIFRTAVQEDKSDEAGRVVAYIILQGMQACNVFLPCDAAEMANTLQEYIPTSRGEYSQTRSLLWRYMLWAWLTATVHEEYWYPSLFESRRDHSKNEWDAFRTVFRTQLSIVSRKDAALKVARMLSLCHEKLSDEMARIAAQSLMHLVLKDDIGNVAKYLYNSGEASFNQAVAE
jgi:hypothetical protein